MWRINSLSAFRNNIIPISVAKCPDYQGSDDEYTFITHFDQMDRNSTKWPDKSRNEKLVHKILP